RVHAHPHHLPEPLAGIVRRPHGPHSELREHLEEPAELLEEPQDDVADGFEETHQPTGMRGTRGPIPHRISYGMVPAARAQSQTVTRREPSAPMHTTRSPRRAGRPVTSTNVRSMLTAATMGASSPLTSTQTRPERERRRPSS